MIKTYFKKKNYHFYQSEKRVDLIIIKIKQLFIFTFRIFLSDIKEIIQIRPNIKVYFFIEHYYGVFT